METSASSKRKLGGEFAVMLLLLLAALSLLLHGIYLPQQTLFSNDGPLGRLISQCHQLPDRFTGCWGDLNGIGFNNGAATPGISLGLQFLLKPVWFSKLYALVALFILGAGAWCFFAQLRLSRMACFLGGLAAALNSCFFSVACWGVAAQAIAAGMMFFAMAALADTSPRLRWWRVVLSGLAVGMAVIEGSDVGAIFSLYVAAFVMYQAWMGEGTSTQKLTAGVSRLALVALCALVISAQAVVALVGTSITGVVGTEQDAQTKEGRWDWATQWSLPVEETTALVVPGLFGYRMDTPGGGCYWGRVGEDPAVERFVENGRVGTPPKGFMRYAGGGYYAGVLVMMLVFWALAQSWRRKDSVFNLSQRKWLWFWLGVAVISLLLCYGRFAPFYQLLYALPYFSTIRNPVKFIYLVSIALIVIFAYGVDGLYRLYMQPVAPDTAPRRVGPKGTPAPARKFEKTWMLGCWIVLGVAVVAWLVYASERPVLVAYLRSVQFHDAFPDAIASFSIRQVGWFVLFYVLSAFLMDCIFARTFAGPAAKWGGVVIGVLLLADLGRANLPWVVYWNYPEKYATNPIIEKLREQSYEHRVTLLNGQSPPNLPSLDKLYRLEWLQQQFPYYNIQTLDIVDMPRKPQDLADYAKALGSGSTQSLLRIWQLTNTRYVLGLANALDPMNQAIGRADQQLRIAERFDIVPKPGADQPALSSNQTAALNDHGAFALFEFTGALPRAKLFSNWQVNTNNQSLLDQLASLDFDPSQTVLVSDALPTAASTNQNNGTVDFTSYAPKDLVFKCNAPAPSVLLVNDHYDPNWKVWVDGAPQKLLRCNFIMRGVSLTPGTHMVEFKFQPPWRLLYVTLAVDGVALLLLIGVLVASRGSQKKI